MGEYTDFSESVEKSCIFMLQKIEEEDTYIRQRMLREAKQDELYWHGFQYVFWDERVQDFRIPTHDVMEQVSSREEVKFIYDYIFNIFKAHGLSIIAALSAEVPGVTFSPFDSDNPKDVLAAKRAEILGKVISKKNKSKLLFYHALFLLFTNHFIASHNSYNRHKKYGTTQIPKFGKGKITPDTYNCADCQFSTEEETENNNCPECGKPLTKQEGEEGLIQVGAEESNLGMEEIIVKGTLNIKIPTYASSQEKCGYLIDYDDVHYTLLRSDYDNVDRDKISLMGTDNFERIARMPSIGRLYTDTYLQSLLTLKKVWIRPWMFQMLDEDDCNEMLDEFPTGVCFHVIDTGSPIIARIEESCLDDHWTIAKSDLSRSVHGDPLGKPILPMQDVENMVGNLLIESLEHSVPSTFADTEILDFDEFSKQEVLPGSVYPTKAPMNPQRSLQDYFYTLKTSTLPKEGVDFGQILDSKTQFLVGSFPSIFGGPQSEGSKTLGEYQESRNYALQRLSIPYQLLYFWWADTNYKAVKDHIKNMIEDEKYSVKSVDGKFTTVNFLMDDFSAGRFELLLPESSVDLPVSFSQKRQLLTQVLQLNSDTLNQYLFSPENRRVTLKYLGMEDFDDLDSNQTFKQLMEIDDMINNNQPVDIEPFLDDDEIHLRVLRTYICSDAGQELKKFNAIAYELLMEHGKQHYENMQMNMVNTQPAPAPQEQQQ